MQAWRTILAIDGGGTKTGAALFAPDGAVLARACGGPCNLYRDLDGGIAAVWAVWRDCCAQAGLDPDAACAGTCLSAGMAGLSVPGAAGRFQTAFAGFGRVCLSGDGFAALVGAFQGGPGALISVGTGVIGCRLDSRGAHRHASGWGFPAGDAGGGAWLGLALVRAWLEHLDGYADSPRSCLWDLVGSRLGTGQPAILAWLRDARPQDFAALAPAIVAAAEAEDDLGARLLDRAAGHLIRLARALDPAGVLALALSGGLAHALRTRLAAAIRLAPPDAPGPLHGAFLIGAGRAPAEHPEETIP